VQGIIALTRKVAIDRDQVLNATHLAGEDDAATRQPQFLGPVRAVDGRRHHRFPIDQCQILGLGALLILVEQSRHQVLIEAAPVDPDPHGAIVLAGELDHLRELLVAAAPLAHVTRVDPELAQGLRAGRLVREQFVAVEVEITHQRHVDAARIQALADMGDRPGRLLRVDGDPYELRTGLGELGDLGASALDVRGIRIRHRLHGDRRIAANGDRADGYANATATDDGIDGIAHDARMGSDVNPVL